MFSRFLELFCKKQLPALAHYGGMRAVKVKQNCCREMDPTAIYNFLSAILHIAIDCDAHGWCEKHKQTLPSLQFVYLQF